MNILEKYSITPKHLINSVDDLPTIPMNKFSIELAIKLYNFAKKHKLEIGNCLSKWVVKLLNLNEQNINQAALIAKIHRTIQNVTDKRGKNKNKFLASIFHVPTCTALPAVQQNIIKDLNTNLNLMSAETRKTNLKLTVKKTIVKNCNRKA